MKKTFHSNGKLLLTGEYVVLDGATALTLPTRFGQVMKVTVSEREGIDWKSLDEKGRIWFENHFSITEGRLMTQNMLDPVQTQLLKILTVAKELNPTFLTENHGWEVRTKIDFPRDWGLGTSSTLINNIAQWSKSDAFVLLEKSFGGSGYDIAAAQNDTPILYERHKGIPCVKKVHLSWDFIDSLFFVHLNKKQNSREEILRYRAIGTNSRDVKRITDISNKLLLCYSLSDFENLMNAHEAIISEIIGLPTIKNQLFPDYPKTIKSLGAWGGDFILVTGNEADKDYYKRKGYKTIVPFGEMIK